MKWRKNSAQSTFSFSRQKLTALICRRLVSVLIVVSMLFSQFGECFPLLPKAVQTAQAADAYTVQPAQRAEYGFLGTANYANKTFTITTKFELAGFANLVNETVTSVNIAEVVYAVSFAPDAVPAKNDAAKTVTLPKGMKGCTVQLGNDIDFGKDYAGGTASGTDVKTYWVPIGAAVGTPFLGTFDGNQKKIVNMPFSKDNIYPYYGLFGFVGATAGAVENNGIIQNVTISSINLTTDEHPTSPKTLYNIVNCEDDSKAVSTVAVGVLAAVNNGVIQNCAVGNTIFTDTTPAAPVVYRTEKSLSAVSGPDVTPSPLAEMSGEEASGAAQTASMTEVVPEADPYEPEDAPLLGVPDASSDDLLTADSSVAPPPTGPMPMPFQPSEAFLEMLRAAGDPPVVIILPDDVKENSVYISRAVNCFGGITGKNIGNMVNCSFNGKFTSTSTSVSGDPNNYDAETGVGGIAGYSSGFISGCVSNAQVSYTAIASASSIAKFGGIVGTQKGGTVEYSAFTGSLTGATASTGTVGVFHTVGGIIGATVGTAVTVKNCITAAQIDISNYLETAAVPNNTISGGIGGLVGFVHSGGLTIEKSASTGIIKGAVCTGGLVGSTNKLAITVVDSYSTMSVDSYNWAAATEYEAVGGLFGCMNSPSSGKYTLQNIYFAGSLLQPQLGSISGVQSAGGWQITLSKLRYDREVSPDGSFTYYTVAAASLPSVTDALRPAEGYYPRLFTGATDPSPVPKSLTLLKKLDNIAAFGWAKVDDTTAVSSDSAGKRNLYQMKNGLTAEDFFHPLTDFGSYVWASTPYTAGYTSEPAERTLGHRYKTELSVDGLSIPVQKKALYAANQTSTQATTLNSVKAIYRFLDGVDLAGAGYLGGEYIAADGIYSMSTEIRRHTGMMCANLRGNTVNPSAVSWEGMNFAVNSVGLFDTTYMNTITGLQFKNATVMIADATSASAHWGLLCRNAVQLQASKLIVDTFSYDSTMPLNRPDNIRIGGLVSQTMWTNVFEDIAFKNSKIILKRQNNGSIRGYVGGLIANILGNTTIRGCTVEMIIDAPNPSRNATQEFCVGGVVGFSNSSPLTIRDCFVQGKLKGETVGGILGRGKYNTLVDCAFVGEIASIDNLDNGAESSGGIMGRIEHSSGNTLIERCFSLGNISSKKHAGGIVGRNSNQGALSGSNTAVIKSCYSAAIINGASSGGGIVGILEKSGSSENSIHTKFEDNYFSGQIQGATNSRGGIVGSAFKVPEESRYTGCAYDQQRDGTLKAIGSVGDNQTLPGGTFLFGKNTDSLTMSETVFSEPTADYYPRFKTLSVNPEIQKLDEIASRKVFRGINAKQSLTKLMDGFYTMTGSDLGVSQEAVTAGEVVFDMQSKPVDGKTETTFTPLLFSSAHVKVAYDAYQFETKPMVLSYEATVKPFDGEGTKEEPYRIYSIEELIRFQGLMEKDVGTTLFYEMVDYDAFNNSTGIPRRLPITIDLASIPDWLPIKNFSGTLKGNGSHIVNLKTGGRYDPVETAEPNVKLYIWKAGLFGSTNGAYIEKLTLDQVSITQSPVPKTEGFEGKTASGSAAGTMVGWATDTVLENCVVSGNITTKYSGMIAGGVMGECRINEKTGRISKVSADVTLSTTYSNNIGGGLIGAVRNVSSSVSYPLLVEQCMTYGSIHQMSTAGGIIGYMDSRRITASVTDCGSLSTFTHSIAGWDKSVGGIIGKVENNELGSLAVSTSYFGGRMDLSGTPDVVSTKIAGGIIGDVNGSSGMLTSDIRNVALTDVFYNSEVNRVSEWYTKVVTKLPDNTYEITYTPQVPKNDSDSDTFAMSQDGLSGNPFNDLKNFNTASVWYFEDGLFPLFTWQKETDGTVNPDVLVKHIAVHYTRAGGDNDYANAFIRYAGAKLASSDSTNTRVTENNKMVVSTKDTEGMAVITLTYTDNNAKTATRKLELSPGTIAIGKPDFSWYFANPGGMWTTPSKNHALYTGDALAGLSLLVTETSEERKPAVAGYYFDANGLPFKTENTVKTFAEEITLGKDISLEAYPNWRPIGTEAEPFVGSFDGKGYCIDGLYIGLGVPESGLFGCISGSATVVKNAAVVPGKAAVLPDLPRKTGIVLSAGMTAVGGITGVLKNGAQIDGCLVSIPLYAQSTSGDLSGAYGGIAGKSQDSGQIKNCAFTGYVYAKGSDAQGKTTYAGGLLGEDTGSASVSGSYAAAYVEGDLRGALIGAVTAATTLTDSRYEMESVGAGVIAVGTPGSSLSAANEIVLNGNKLYPLPGTGFAGKNNPVLTTVRIPVAIFPHARSTTQGSLAYADAIMRKSETKPGGFDGVVTFSGDNRAFVKETNGMYEMEVLYQGTLRTVAFNIQCWYENPDSNGVRYISTAAELVEFAELVNETFGKEGAITQHSHKDNVVYDSFNGKTVKLAADINLSDIADLLPNWQPVGTDQKTFQGIFDGQGYVIYNLNSASAPKPKYSGLFGVASATAQILNTGVSGGTISNGQITGGLVAKLEAGGKIEGCFTSLTLSGDVAGGLVGENSGIIRNCFSMSGIVGSGVAGGLSGGLAGTNHAGGTIEQSYFSGYCSIAEAVVGGISAKNEGSVRDCYVAGYLDGRTKYSAAKDAENCLIDNRLTNVTRDDKKTTPEAKPSFGGAAWIPADANHASRLKYFSATAFAGDSLLQAEKISGMNPEFFGYPSANHAQFTTVQVDAVTDDVILYSRDGKLEVDAKEASLKGGLTGETVLAVRVGTLEEGNIIDRPLLLQIPATFGFTYQFDFSELIAQANTENPDYHPSTTSGNTWSTSNYLISTADDFVKFVSYVNSGNLTANKTFTLNYNIDLSGKSASEIMITKPFSGIFDGGCYTLSNLTFSESKASLFSEVTETGRIKMLALENVTITATHDGEMYAASIAAINRGKIHNVSVSNCTINVKQNSASAAVYIGGLVAQNEGWLKSSILTAAYIQADIPLGAQGNLVAGAMTGQNSGEINGCYAEFDWECKVGGNVTDNYVYIKTLSGVNTGLIRYSYWDVPAGNSPADKIVAYEDALHRKISAYGYYVGYISSKRLSGEGDIVDDPSALEPRAAIDPVQVAEWLSCDSYGMTYYTQSGQLRLYCFELIKYDFSSIMKDIEYTMLSLQYTNQKSSKNLFSNGICTYKGYEFPNFMDLQNTTELRFSIPMISRTLDFEVTEAKIHDKDDTVIKYTRSSGTITPNSSHTEYRISGFTDNSTRVIVTIALTPKAQVAELPWGVYRKDSTGKRQEETQP